MDKILLPLDSEHINLNTIVFACYIAELTGSDITGAFIDNFDIAEDPVPDQSSDAADEARADFIREKQGEETLAASSNNIDLFKEACIKRGIGYEVTHFSFPDILGESRFSDLIIVDAKIIKDDLSDEVPSKLVKNLLSLAECPVLIAPEEYQEFKQIIHCYDGSKASVFAIKQCAYLFPQLADLKSVLLQVNKASEWSVSEEDEIKQWLSSHYKQFEFKILHGNVGDELQNFLNDNNQDALVTMGAYGRSTISNAIRESRGNQIIREVNLPLFIAHP